MRISLSLAPQLVLQESQCKSIPPFVSRLWARRLATVNSQQSETFTDPFSAPSRMHPAYSLCLLLALLHVSTGLLLGAFNIKSFGDKKASNTTLMNIISKIVHRYDILLIQEVRDNDLSATEKLMQHVNKGSPQFRYKHIVSEPLGRSSYKERYLFLYREATASVGKNYTYDDGCEPCGSDTFIREPFVVMFSSDDAVVRNFVLIPQHASPDFASQEVDELWVSDTHILAPQDIVLLGDFNTDCTYVTGSDWMKIRLFTDKSFHWLIPNEADTTVSHTHCAYDRIVVTDDMMKGVAHHSAEVYDFMVDLNLSFSMALAVSDHFPVEVKLLV
ncbi:deoxyribonuclease-1 isoform X2 [Phyllopteryx taeniolatus]|uniref:deoxyribonuclease-1 isoform X2 n=1 Tax=Phyllopteryx taeniolatus TaxID=161469 RepID=UPI002AD3F530|nr:deoxyribonuclease-1 isoform X2 [Phyllopteryx taeniolatus]